MNTDQRIAQLKPGQSLRISGNSKTWLTAERSGNGKTLRLIRETPNSFHVVSEQRF